MTVHQFRPPSQDQPLVEGLTDASHAERFAATYADRLRYNHQRGEWFIKRGPLYRPDVDGQVYRFGIEFARSCQLEGLNAPTRDARERLTRHGLQAESKPALDRLVSLARNVKPLADSGETWDSDPWRVGAHNGIVNLQTGELETGSPDTPITKAVSVPYDPDARCPRFERFLGEIFRGDLSLIRFVRQFFGYSLTGLTTEQVLLLLYGTGANGKSTLVNIIAHVFGDYAINLPFSTIELKQRASIPSDLAALAGRRLATASETNDGTRLNEARVKALTGCDPITARFLHADWFTFRPTAKFVLSVNHKPAIHDDSHGFWRRIRLVPFMERFEGPRRDDELEQRLRDEAAGILTWCLQGCLEWQTVGLTAPGLVVAATTDYQTDSDPLAEFVEECCALDDHANTRAAALHDAYAKWADRQCLTKFDRLTAKDFGRRLAERFERRHTREGWVYNGVRVSTERLW